MKIGQRRPEEGMEFGVFYFFRGPNQPDLLMGIASIRMPKNNAGTAFPLEILKSHQNFPRRMGSSDISPAAKNVTEYGGKRADRGDGSLRDESCERSRRVGSLFQIAGGLRPQTQVIFPMKFEDGRDLPHALIGEFKDAIFNDGCGLHFFEGPYGFGPQGGG